MAPLGDDGSATTAEGDDAGDESGGRSPTDLLEQLYAREVGAQLRSVRKHAGLSLHDVAARSGREFKASTLGAYERGERTISVPRLRRLADIYGVTIRELLPRDIAIEIDLTIDRNGIVPGALPPTRHESTFATIDLPAIYALEPPHDEMMQRYVSMVQRQRGEFGGRVLTIRHDDGVALAGLLGESAPLVVRRAEGRRFEPFGTTPSERL